MEILGLSVPADDRATPLRCRRPRLFAAASSLRRWRTEIPAATSLEIASMACQPQRLSRYAPAMSPAPRILRLIRGMYVRQRQQLFENGQQATDTFGIPRDTSLPTCGNSGTSSCTSRSELRDFHRSGGPNRRASAGRSTQGERIRPCNLRLLVHPPGGQRENRGPTTLSLPTPTSSARLLNLPDGAVARNQRS